MTTTTWTSICEDIASLQLAAESFEAMPQEHKPELLELMQLSTQRLTARLGEMEHSYQVALQNQIAQQRHMDQQIQMAQESQMAQLGQVAPQQYAAVSQTAVVAPPPTPPEQTPFAAAPIQPATPQPAPQRAPLDASQKHIRRRRPKRTPPKGVVSATILTDNERLECTVLNESETGMGIAFELGTTPEISNGHNVRIIHLRRLRLARVMRTVSNGDGRFEIGVKWL